MRVCCEVGCHVGSGNVTKRPIMKAIYLRHRFPPETTARIHYVLLALAFLIKNPSDRRQRTGRQP